MSLLKLPISQISEDEPGRLERIGREASFDFRVDRPGYDGQIRPAIVIEVGKSRAPAGVASLYAEATCKGYVSEVSFSVVFVEDVGIV